MTFDVFETHMHRLYAAFGKIANSAQMSEYFDSFKSTDDSVFISAFQAMKDECERFPTIAMMKSKIAQAQRSLYGSGKSHFDQEKWQAMHGGKGCTCDMGLIFTYRKNEHGQRCSFVYRCWYCKCYDAPGIPFFTGDALNEERQAA